MPRQNEGNEASALTEFERGLLIDKNDLDGELIGQPDMFYRVSRAYADAISYRDGLKLDLSEAVANLDQAIRQKAAEAEQKMTEGAIAKEIELAPKIGALKKDYGRACHKADLWQALKESYQQRSYVLKDLSALWIAGYYTNNSGGAARHDAKNRVAEEAREAVRRVRNERGASAT